MIELVIQMVVLYACTCLVDCNVHVWQILTKVLICPFRFAGMRPLLHFTACQSQYKGVLVHAVRMAGNTVIMAVKR